jgi:glycosyltransferase involved in cell wall biosynthesis
MILGIDASNIRAGGGITHLMELLNHADPVKYGFSNIIVWAPEATLLKLKDQTWLIKKSHPFLNGTFLFRLIWQKFFLYRQARQYCNILFLPSGNTSGFHPYVSMCQNLLPFEPVEKARFGLSLVRLRYELLKWNQCISFKKAEGVIFLSNYSLNIVEKICGDLNNKIVIPHGVAEIFSEKRQNDLLTGNTINILYVSIINFYKHQEKVVLAVYKLLDLGYDVNLILIGSSYPPALKMLKGVINTRPEYKEKIVILDKVPYEKLADYYHSADFFVFASSCETFGMIVLEAMASGSAIACSNLSSMKEIARESVLYFNPLNEGEITATLLKYVDNPDLRKEMSKKSLERSAEFSWQKCSEETLFYLSETNIQYINKSYST